jgi:acyl-coenzyme A synthetase/AMP-(fatty) acid ligase
VAAFAGALQNKLGIKKGDVVVIYMSMQVEAMIAMLACTRYLPSSSSSLPLLFLFSVLMDR